MRFSAESSAAPPDAALPALAIARPAASPVEPGGYFRWKYWLERCLAALILLPVIAVIGVVTLLVRLTSPGPAIYRQLRVGRHGRTYLMYKIRTMRSDAEATTGPVWACQGDPRITPVGRVLRKLHLDELPQLWNVLRGEMSLVGPRPERPEFTRQLALHIPDYLERLTVLPGITGLAQINLPPDSDLDSVRRKVALDLEYIATAGLLLDLRMLLCTGLRLLGISGATAMRLFALQRTIYLRPTAAAGTSDTMASATSPEPPPNPQVAEPRSAVNGVGIRVNTPVSRNGAAVNGHAAKGSDLNGAVIHAAAVNGAADSGAPRLATGPSRFTRHE